MRLLYTLPVTTRSVLLRLHPNLQAVRGFYRATSHYHSAEPRSFLAENNSLSALPHDAPNRYSDALLKSLTFLMCLSAVNVINCSSSCISTGYSDARSFLIIPPLTVQITTFASPPGNSAPSRYAPHLFLLDESQLRLAPHSSLLSLDDTLNCLVLQHAENMFCFLQTIRLVFVLSSPHYARMFPLVSVCPHALDDTIGQFPHNLRSVRSVLPTASPDSPSTPGSSNSTFGHMSTVREVRKSVSTS